MDVASTPPQRQLLTLPEAAAVLGLGLTTTKGLVYAGTLPSVKIGPKTRRVPVSALERFVNGLQAET